MKKFYCFINPLFDGWCIYTIMVFYIVLYFVFLIFKATFYNLDIIIPIMYVPVFIFSFVLPYFLVKQNICRILAIKQNNCMYTIFYQDGLIFHKLHTNSAIPVKLIINIAIKIMINILNWL